MILAINAGVAVDRCPVKSEVAGSTTTAFTVSVNPFKQMHYFTDKEVELYQGAVSQLFLIQFI